jgi:hypothetical protein
VLRRPANGPGGEREYVPGGSRLAQFWADLKLAARDTTHDYTTGPIGRAILLLAVPMVLEMVMESIFAVADMFWVAKLGAGRVERAGVPARQLEGQSGMNSVVHRPRKWYAAPACRTNSDCARPARAP